MFTLHHILSELFSMPRFCTMLLKKLLKVSASSRLLVIVLLLSFDIMKEFLLEKGDLLVSRLFCYHSQLY